MLLTALLIFVTVLWDFFVHGLFKYKVGYIIGFRYLCQCFDFDSTLVHYSYLFILTFTTVIDIIISYYLGKFIILDILMYIFFIWLVATSYQNYDSLHAYVDPEEIRNEKIRKTAHLIFVILMVFFTIIKVIYMLNLEYEGYDITIVKWIIYIISSISLVLASISEGFYWYTKKILSPIFIKILTLIWIIILPYLTILQIIIKCNELKSALS